MDIWTIGHSNRSIEDFIHLLQTYEIQLVADIRRLPGSNTYPHFNQEALARSLAAAGRIEYVWIPELGGRRKRSKGSRNTAWRSKSFQAYADHMETEEFQLGIQRLLEFAGQKRTTMLCSEAVWWRCHRSLVADYLKSTNVNVIHILSESSSEVHPYTSAAKIKDGKLSYESDGEEI
jgi:uncharacterized protein (DUF488 family)